MILVAGATGTVGREVLRLLVEQGVPARAMTRDPTRLSSVETNVEVVQANFDAPETLRDAVAGVEGVFLLTAPGASVPEHDLAMINAAARVGRVRKVVKLSAVGGRLSANDGGTEPADWHAPGEQALAGSGLAWTVLRPSSFASNTLRWANAIRAGQPVPNMTGSGTQGVVDPRDVAEVAVEALLGEHDGLALTLTGPDLVSVPDQVAQLADVLDKPISTIDVPLEAAREQMLASGLDPSVVDVAVRGSQLVRDGGNAVVTDDVHRVLCRPARPVRTWALDHRGAFLEA